MNFFNNWLHSIVIAVIVSTIIEMLILEGNNKKYIKTVIGIYILFTIIAPMVSLVTKKEFNLKDVISLENEPKKINMVDTDYQVKELYIDNIKNDIKSRVEEKGYILSNLDITLVSDKEYNLSSIKMQVGKNDTNKKSNKVHIDEISIGDSSNKENNKETTISKKEIEDLKEYLSSNYGAKENQIYIEEYRK